MQTRLINRMGRLAVAIVVLVSLFTAVGPASAAEVSVAMVDDAFMPPTITIQTGDRITWVNRGTHGHTVTSDSGLWDSGTVAGSSASSGGSYSGGSYDSGSSSSGSSGGQAYWVEFHRAGTYGYLCRFHAAQGMRGTVVVVDPLTTTGGSNPLERPQFSPFHRPAGRR